ncbi:MAG: glycosyltransferase [Candidatus Nomurabacteria bacterium]|nr:glycosyltransferase [Candidatus Nomurabacteria bacterium]
MKLISIIIPCYNNADTIDISLDSLINQTYKNLEIIVVDDNSTDDLYSTIKQYIKKDSRIKYIKNTDIDPYRINRIGTNINAGYSARNFGIQHATGDIITFQDADDASLLDRIEVQYNLMKKYNAKHVLVGWQSFKQNLVGTKLDSIPKESDILSGRELENFLQENPPVPRFLRDPNSKRLVNSIPFVQLVKRLARKLFFHEIKSLPGCNGIPMITRAVIEKIQFRPLWERTHPSRRGRGADTDFNYQVLEIFRSTVVVNLPLYLWKHD